MIDNKKNIILKTENLSIGYSNKKQQKIIASNINVDFKKGEFVAVLGKNGIGKSTFLRTISNVQPPLSGSVFINQKKIEQLDSKLFSKQLSMVLTERLPESQLTVYEIVASGRQPYTNWIDKLSEDDKNKIFWAIQETKIEHLQNEYFYELSDGQLQRVLIARALAQDTNIIVLDEPTAHLDLDNTLKIFSLLKKLVDKFSKTVIISSHQLNLSIQFSNKIVLFTEAKVISDSPKTLSDKGFFDDLFPKENITFNRELQQFVIGKF